MECTEELACVCPPGNNLGARSTLFALELSQTCKAMMWRGGGRYACTVPRSAGGCHRGLCCSSRELSGTTAHPSWEELVDLVCLESPH